MTMPTPNSFELVTELRRRGVGEVDDSTLARALYSSDASLYRVVPQAVVKPRETNDLAQVPTMHLADLFAPRL